MTYRETVINAALQAWASNQRRLMQALAKVAVDNALDGEGLEILRPDEQAEVDAALAAGEMPYCNGECQRCGG